MCINPCAEDSCGENAECYPVNHGTECKCLPGHQGNPYITCSSGTNKIQLFFIDQYGKNKPYYNFNFII